MAVIKYLDKDGHQKPVSGIASAALIEVDGYLCTYAARVGNNKWAQREPASYLDTPYLNEYGYRCALADGTQELYQWIYRCLCEGFSVPYRTIVIDGVETVFETAAAKDDTEIVAKVNADYGEYAERFLNLLHSDDIGWIRIPLVQFEGLTEESVRHAFERVCQDAPELCFPFFPLAAFDRVYMPLISAEDGYSFLYSFFPSEKKREEIKATIAAAVEAVTDKVFEVHGIKTGDALTEDQKRKVCKTIHDWIVINGAYESGQKVAYWCATIYGALNPELSAVCEGYAQAFNYLVRLYGIEAITLTGEAAYGWNGEDYDFSGGHAWNAVCLTDEYGQYCTDAAAWTPIDVYWDMPAHEESITGARPEGNVIWKYFMDPANLSLPYGSESYREITTEGSYGDYPFDGAPSADYPYNGNSEYIWED